MSRGAIETSSAPSSRGSTSLATRTRPPKTQGYTVEEEVNEEDGSIRLVVGKWVAE